MPTTPRSQMALAADTNFQRRITSLLLSEAMVVAAEPTSVEFHTQRRNLAQRIIDQPPYMAATLAPTIANGTNLVAADTQYNFEAFAIETTAGDPEIRSQIATLWNVMAGV